MTPTHTLVDQPGHIRPRTWAALGARLAEPNPTRNGLYSGLGRRISTRPHGADDGAAIWSSLSRRVTPAEYCPRRSPSVSEERLVENQTSYIVLRSPVGSYMRLSEEEHALWQLMDGSQSIARLATTGLMRFRRLLPVAGLVQDLRQQGFLAEQQTGIYHGLRTRQEARSVEGFGQRVIQSLRGRMFAFEGIDGFVDALYRWGGRFLFTRFFGVIHALICVAGLICFVRISWGTRAGNYTVLSADNVGFSLLALWAALIVSFVLHELAHALTVKHFGRRVLRGGVMLYYGMPAAFVDTSDIWLAGRRARILTSLAGPLCDMLVGSLAAGMAYYMPAGLIGEAAYKLAVACYLAALFNFNPLLELDGYFMLSDWLNLPNMRPRALTFISGPLWQKLRSRYGELRQTDPPPAMRTLPAALLGGLAREERIFALYGLLAAAYTTLAVVLAGLFWREQLTNVIIRLWDDGPFARMLAALIVIGVVAPVSLGLIFAAWGLVRAAARWVASRGYGRSPLIVALALGALVVSLSALAFVRGFSSATAIVALMLWLAALAAQRGLHTDYRGAAVARALDSFLVVSVLELLAIGGRLLGLAPQLLWPTLEIVGFALLMVAGFVALLDVDLRQSRHAELVTSALLLGLAFLAGGLSIGVIQQALPAMPFVWMVIAASPVYASAVTMALLLLLLFSLRDSRLFWSWLLLWLGIAVQTGSYLLGLLEGGWRQPLALAALTLAAGLWAAAWCSHYVALRQVHPRGLSWPIQAAQSESLRLQYAFQHTYAGLYRMLREHYGARSARTLDDRLDVLAATANWDITIDREQARISPTVAAGPLDVQGLRYAEVLRYTVAAIESLAGATFARRAVLAAYDALPWPEREAADRRCFPHTPWAAELSRAFGDAREARLRLLRQVELFAVCSDSELHSLASAMEIRQVAAGQLLFNSKAKPQGLWIVEAGEVLAKRDQQIVRELHRGDFFGELGHSDDQSYSYRTSVESSLLYLPSHELQRMLSEAAPHTAEGVSMLENLRLLERTPLLHDLPRDTLRALARAARREHLPARSLIVRQGRPSGVFYVIAAGEAVVVRRNDISGAEGSQEPARVIARLGPAEFFGEIELLRGTPPVASIVSLSAIELVALPHAAIAEVLTGAREIARGLEQLGSGRLIGLRQG